MAISTDEEVLEYISNRSVLELSELVKKFEEKFGVSAAPVMVAGGAGAGDFPRAVVRLSGGVAEPAGAFPQSAEKPSDRGDVFLCAGGVG